MLVEALMTSDFEAPNIEASISDIESIAFEYEIYHLPICKKDGTYLGTLCSSCITDEDREKNSSLSHYISDLMPASIKHNAFVFDTLKTFVEEEYTALPVMDKDDNIIGLLRLIDIINYLEKTTSIKHKGAFITLKLGQNDYNLQQIARIVESNDAKILSIHFEPETVGGDLLCTIKINQEDLSHILATFERFEYLPVANSSTDTANDDMSQRYNLLMKFLNI